jgi:hypothetical protein
MNPYRTDEQGVAIRRTLGHEIGSNIAAMPRTVFNNDRYV